MSANPPPLNRQAGSSLLRNLTAGSYGPLERLRLIAANVGLKISRRSACCGHYGDPGC
jgi:hypothetical protein